MKDQEKSSFFENEKVILLFSGICAFLIEFSILLLIVLFQANLAPVSSEPVNQPTRYVDAEIFDMPIVKDLHNAEEHTPIALPAKKKIKVVRPKLTAPKKEKTNEPVLSKISNDGRSPNSPSNVRNQTEGEENRTLNGIVLPPDHDPIAIYNPAPIVPEYLLREEIKTSVIVEFFIMKTGETSVHLISSSGNEELDAIAITTTSKWRFYPAEKDHIPLDSKVKLRIVFEVR